MTKNTFLPSGSPLMIQTTGMTDVSYMAGRHADNELLKTADLARSYLSSQPWCRGIRRLFFDRGFGSVAVFYAEVDSAPSADDALWIVAGDVPPLYIDISGAVNGAQALEAYVLAMKGWTQESRGSGEIPKRPELYSVNGVDSLEPTSELIDMLTSRLKFIEEGMLREWQEELNEVPAEGWEKWEREVERMANRKR